MDNTVILFDLDNTLVEIDNSYQYFDQIIVDVFDEVGVKPPSSEQRDKLWRNMDFGKLLEEWNFQDSKLFWRIFDRFDLERRCKLHQEGKLRVYDDVVPTLNKIQEYSEIYPSIISNTTQKIVECELSSMNLIHYFQQVYGLGDKQEECKPSLLGLDRILKNINNEFQFSKENVYIVGDSSSDILVGNNAGITSILINRHNRNPKNLELHPTFFIQSLDELLDILSIEQ